MKKAETVACTHCGALHPQEELCVFEGELYCRDCLDDEYSYCTGCGRLILSDELHYLNSSDDDGYCGECCDARQGDIQNYYYKPNPIFLGKRDRYFGVELEIDGAGERNDRAQRLMAIANRGCERIYIKHDGSLDGGMEIVTHPMTLQYHLDEMPWPEVLEEAVHMGHLSHQACTCGLHVHVNRDAFGETETEQEEVIARILFFVENYWNELLRFSCRSRSQMEQWAARYGRKDDPKAVLDNEKRNHYERYRCVNLTNYNTIEFRMFRGTLKLNTLLATLQMVDRICEVALDFSDAEMQNLTWTDFVSGCTAPELVQYLKERRLYVSEPVESEVEV